MTRALYVCYFGLREPLVQTQVLPYLRELARGGVEMVLLTFEREPRGAWVAEWRERLRGEGIEWERLRYHSRPTLPAKLFDILAGAWLVMRIARRKRLDIVHGRSHVGAAIGVLARTFTGAKVIFDVRGLLAEEYVESGNWPAGGARYRLTKRAERSLLAKANGVVVLTERAKSALIANDDRRPVEVIPCCVGPEKFVAREARSNKTVFVYAGALGGYYLTREMAELIAAARGTALILTHGPAEAMRAELERAGVEHRVLSVAAEEVPRYLCTADVGLILLRPGPARIAGSPTKFAEYLAAGLPVIATAGIGDLDAHIEEGRVGVLLRGFDRESYVEALRAMDELRRDPALAERCRAEARTRYDLESVGGARYRRLYEALR